MLITIIQTAIQEISQIARQASALATALQNAAPPGTSLQSAKYLVEIAVQLENIVSQVQDLLQKNNESGTEVLQLVQATVEQDAVLRKEYNIADKFRFVRERLQAAYQQLEQALKVTVKEIEQRAQKNVLLEDEVTLYVYLYNANGVALSSWQSMLVPKVFYEYSVNRPIYMEKTHIEKLLRSKSNKTQHAYLAVAVKKVHVLQSEAGIKDSLGNPLVKIKEGSLSFEKLLFFVCNEQGYVLNEQGILVKKS